MRKEKDAVNGIRGRGARALAWAALLLVAAPARAADDVVIADFEANDYGAWQVEGEAFGAGPARGTLANQQKVSGFLGKGLVNTYLQGDRSQGTLTSPEFVVDRAFVNFLVGGGNRPGEAAINLLIDGKPVKSETGRDDERLDWATWDVSAYRGKRARVQIVDRATGGWGHINVDQIVLSDEKKAAPSEAEPIVADRLYEETYRPRFHFSARKGWLNDPNGLVYQNGEWHLFFQHNPFGTEWGNMTWGHAVSKNLVNWEQLPNALEPDATGTMYSGSAVIDHENTAGFGRGAMVVLYTAAGGENPQSKGKPYTQCLAYSTDGGRTLTKWSGNPVLANITPGNRDPKVFWHGPTKKWVMALWVEVVEGAKKVNTIQLFGSPDLKKWTYLSRYDGFFECPDLFELPVDGDAGKAKWVMFGADGDYVIGTFDGTTFTREFGPFKSDHGANFYAAQTYSDAPDARRVLIGWMRGGRFPAMPFNQQMSFPVELSLRPTPDGVRMFKWPVKEIGSLAGAVNVPSPADQLETIPDLADVELAFAPSGAVAVTLDVHGTPVTWKGGRLTVGNRSAELKPVGGKVALRILADRTSLEVFGNRGAAVVSNCVLRRSAAQPARGVLRIEGGEARDLSVRVTALKSAWK